MTPKEKATELVAKFKSNVYKKAFANTDFMYDRYYGLDDEMAKQCALIAVEQIKDAIFWHPYESPNFELEYWNEVKKEIEAL